MAYVFRSTEMEPKARGLEFGQKHSRQVKKTVEAYRALFARSAKRPFDLEAMGLSALAAIQGFSPALFKEMEGIAAGAGVPLAHIGAINARTEILAAIRAAVRGECSVVVKLDAADSPPLALQTWDWYHEFHDQWLIWEIPQPDGGLTTTVTEYGIVGKIGVNKRGLGVLFAILHHERDGARMGVPVHVLSRSVLDTAKNANKALQLLASADVSASSAITVIGVEQGLAVATSVELHPGGPGFVFPELDGLLIHTNHFLSESGRGGDTEPRSFPDTLIRHDQLRRRLSNRDRLDVPEALSVMSNHVGGNGAVCSHVDPAVEPTGQFATLITVALDVAAGSLIALEGGPCRQSNAGIDLDRSGPEAPASRQFHKEAAAPC